MTDGSTTLKINHADHGMIATGNNVTITGAKSPATTVLNGAISDTSTGITLSDGASFNINNTELAHGAPVSYTHLTLPTTPYV